MLRPAASKLAARPSGDFDHRQGVGKMSYFVLALGGLLSVGGAVTLLTSYGIILVERGWAGVIAGTTALASGIVTIALGIILHRLSGFYELLAGKSELSLLRGLAEQEAGEPGSAQTPRYLAKAGGAPEAGPDSAGVQPASGSRSWPQRPARPFHSPGRNVLKSRAAGAPAPARFRESLSVSIPNEGAADGRSEAGSGPATPAEMAEEGIGPNTPPRQAPLEETYAEAAGRGARSEPGPSQDSAGDDALTVEPSAEVAIAEGYKQPWPESSWPAEPAMIGTIEMILPQAGHAGQPAIPEPGNETAEPLSEPREAAGLEPPTVAFETGAEAYLAETGSSSEPPSDDATSGGTVAIIGRYESEGASFVRYADGSIEARTDHAVFHFKSMAELKSFMESQAQAPKR
jgi:hypothetical protein